MNFYSPWGFLALIGVPIIIVLYLLKQRHEDFKVSSLYLWEEVIKDLEANAPWQKLKKNLLMILQILAVILFAFSLSRPFLSNFDSQTQNVIVVIDTSMSMQAQEGSRSRFDDAKSNAREYVTSLRPDTRVTLISMGKNTIIEENLSSNKNNVINSLNAIEVTNSALNINDAESIISSIVNQYPDTKVAVFGDQKFFIDGVDMEFSDISREGENFAITMLSHTVTENGITALSTIANYSKEDAKIPLSIYIDGNVFDARNVDVKKGESLNVYWRDLPRSANIIEVRIDKEDALLLDNTFWNVVGKGLDGKALLVSNGNVFIEKVLALSNQVDLYKTMPDETREFNGYELYIFDGFLPETIPEDGSIMVFNPPENQLFQVREEVEVPQIIELRGDILKYVKEFEFSIGESKILEVPLWAEEIIELNKGSGAFKGVYNNQRVLVLGFDIFKTDISMTPAFPIFMTDAVEWLMPSAIENIDNVNSGDSIEFNLHPGTEKAFVKTPTGEEIEIAPPFPARVFDKTNHPGIYTLVQNTFEGEVEYKFSVNVPSRSESDINKKVVGTVDGSDERIEERDIIKTGKNIQFIFMWIIITVLLIEWWVYKNGI
ncbi:BatA and WFA domain-containing protein [Herbivorax sp. ANBcel31]|uniref:vWA domain-containing protein n=1 Tax=Herbivorax sp. ANBcel31 TaxID=3069754 RepID=UPI0027B36E08|nr:BatA and WFA domain-containing protein [Herbivorax sp. ANBcel31]MDQ2087187.1 BatA and WFA domain-containing protein [Herbivorax sp. ANBcel31]